MTDVLVLGANGFIGRAIARALADRTVSVLGAGIGAPPADRRIAWRELDLLATSTDELARWLADTRPAAVVNATGATIGSIASLVEANVVTTGRLVEALAASSLALRLVHIGSAAEYGIGRPGEATGESAPAAPVGPYGITKLAATGLVTSLGREGTVAPVVLRVFNPLGPAMPESALPGAAVRRIRDAIATRSAEVGFGPLSAVRDFVDIRDIASAAAAACLTPARPPSVLNVGSGQPRSARELVEAIAARLGFAGRILEGSAGSSRSADVEWQVADITLARETLGWAPAHDLASSVELLLEPSDRRPDDGPAA